MKSNRLYPVYTLSYLLICLIQKGYIYLFNGLRRDLDISVYLSFPLMFYQDILVAVVIFLLFDLFLHNFQSRITGRFSGLVVSTLNILYFFIVLYSLLILKFYTNFGMYFTYGLLIQAHNISSYRSGFREEFDLSYALLILFSVIYFFGTLKLNSVLKKKKTSASFFTLLPDNNRAPGSRTMLQLFKSRECIASISLLIYISASYSFTAFFHENRDLYFMDSNPLAEIIISTVKGITGTLSGDSVALSEEVDLKEKTKLTPAVKMSSALGGGVKREAGRVVKDPGGGKFSSDSIISSDIDAKGIGVKKVDDDFIRNLNIVFYLFESTSGKYISPVNREFEKYTPNIQRISSSSILLENHYCQEPASLKSIFSILTGKYPYKTRNWWQFVKKSRSDVTIAEILKDKGYNTIFITAQDGRTYYQNRFLYKRFHRIVDKHRLKRLGWNYRDFTFSIDDRILIRYFDKFLKEDLDKGKFFAFISSGFPHHPYHIPSEKFRINRGRRSFDRYKNSLYFSDHVLGKIYDLLEKYGIRNNTLFVVFSDHGEAFYQHPGNFIHSIYLYEENVRTFCLISNPVLFKGSRYKNITRHIDIVPTILDLLKIKKGNRNFDGVSLLKPHSNKFASFYTGWSNPYLGLRDGKWKYLLNRRYNSEELYDLSIDAGEKKNLSSKFPGISSMFRERMLKFEKHIE